MLIGQGLEQFAMWSKLSPPSEEIQAAVLEFYEFTTKA
jgi:shikimate 5-dehydrogenase